MGIFEYLNNKKSGDYKSKKENNTVETIKRMVAVGLLTASIATAGVASTGCESKTPDMPYEEAVALVDSKIDNLNKDLEYDSIAVGVDQNKKYLVIFMDSKTLENVSFNISKKEYNRIMGSVNAVESDAIIASPDGNFIVIEKSTLEDSKLQNVLSNIFSSVAGKEPFVCEKQIQQGDNQQDNRTAIQVIDEEANQVKDVLTNNLGLNFKDFAVDEITLTKIEGTFMKPGIAKVFIAGKDSGDESAKNNNSNDYDCVLVMTDYYDTNGDGINDKYRYCTRLISEENYNKLESLLANYIDNEDIKIVNDGYVIQKDCLSKKEYSGIANLIKDAINDHKSGWLVQKSGADLAYEEILEMAK